MNPSGKNTLFREMLAIIALSMLLAFVYNAFSLKGISLIRAEPIKIGVEDSVLFPANPVVSDTAKPSIMPQPQKSEPEPDMERMRALSKSKPSEANKKKSVYKVVTLAQVKRLLDKGRGLFIDARDAEAYHKGHIKGAINIFGDEPDQHFEELGPIPRDTLVVIYCNGLDCHLGRALAEFMNIMEFTNLLLYDEGWDGWQKANMPEEKSP